jgi:hypothetical protein
MAFFMFIDESGQDQRESPYEVLAGVVIEDKNLWPLIHALHKTELGYFGCRYATEERELKAKRLLKTKTFRQAGAAEPIDSEVRRKLAKKCLETGAGAPPRQQAALAQAKIGYVGKVLELAAAFDCKAFASIAPQEAPRPTDDYLRRDYAFLFERFYFLLREQAGEPRGIVVFDELGRSQSHLLIDQMARYFMGTTKGRTRRRRIIPEPFFVQSHLTTGIHLPDLVAYIISWGVRISGMSAPARPELAKVALATQNLRYDMRVREGSTTRRIWAFNLLRDLRPWNARVPKATQKKKAM